MNRIEINNITKLIFISSLKATNSNHSTDSTFQIEKQTCENNIIILTARIVTNVLTEVCAISV